MRSLRALLFRLAGLFSRDQRDRDLAEEFESHLQLQIEDNLRKGMSVREARRMALLNSGGIESAKEKYRDQRSIPILEELLQDLRYAVRTLRKNPGFLTVAVLTLALGLGVTTAIFSIVYALLVKPLPYRNAGDLYAIRIEVPQMRDKFPSVPVRAKDFIAWRDAGTAFSQIVALSPVSFNLTGTGEPEKIGGARVSWNLLELFGVQPAIGRSFTVEEDQPGRDHVVLISHEIWTRRFGADPAILNKTIALDGQSYDVVGVMPADFLFPAGKQLHPLVPFASRVDIWRPLALSPDEASAKGSWNYGVLARIAAGASPEQGLQQLQAIAERKLQDDVPGNKFNFRVQVVPIRDMFAGNVRTPILILFAASGLVLMIACVNMANLLLARFTNRMSEVATRAALGASRRRLMRQLTAESLLIAILGAGLGALLAALSVRVFIAYGPADVPMIESIRVSLPVLMFTIAAALLTGIVFGLVPAAAVFSRNLHEFLRQSSRSATAAFRNQTFRRALIGVEVALSTCLLITAGLLLHSYVNVMRVAPGFETERILAVDLSLPGTQYRDDAQKVAFFQNLTNQLRYLPGVTAAGAINVLPLMAELNTTVAYLESDTDAEALVLKRPFVTLLSATPGYFATMKVALHAGRYFFEKEPARGVIISEKLARQLWPGESSEAAIGKLVKLGSPKDAGSRIIGVVADVRTGALDRESIPQLYRPHHNEPSSTLSVVVRTSQDPRALAEAIRGEVRKLDRNLPVPLLRTMQEIVSTSVAQRHFQMVLILLFGVLALLLAAIGIYGVVSYSVATQTREFGLRLALGAVKTDIIRPVVIRGLTPVIAGAACGVGGSIAAAAVLRSVLFGVKPLDAITLASVIGVLLVTATLACLVPAWRATRLDPVTALRHE